MCTTSDYRERCDDNTLTRLNGGGGDVLESMDCMLVHHLPVTNAVCIYSLPPPISPPFRLKGDVPTQSAYMLPPVGARGSRVKSHRKGHVTMLSAPFTVAFKEGEEADAVRKYAAGPVNRRSTSPHTPLQATASRLDVGAIAKAVEKAGGNYLGVEFNGGQWQQTDVMPLLRLVAVPFRMDLGRHLENRGRRVKTGPAKGGTEMVLFGEGEGVSRFRNSGGVRVRPLTSPALARRYGSAACRVGYVNLRPALLEEMYEAMVLAGEDIVANNPDDSSLAHMKTRLPRGCTFGSGGADLYSGLKREGQACGMEVIEANTVSGLRLMMERTTGLPMAIRSSGSNGAASARWEVDFLIGDDAKTPLGAADLQALRAVVQNLMEYAVGTNVIEVVAVDTETVAQGIEELVIAFHMEKSLGRQSLRVLPTVLTAAQQSFIRGYRMACGFNSKYGADSSVHIVRGVGSNGTLQIRCRGQRDGWVAKSKQFLQEGTGGIVCKEGKCGFHSHFPHVLTWHREQCEFGEKEAHTMNVEDVGELQSSSLITQRETRAMRTKRAGLEAAGLAQPAAPLRATRAKGRKAGGAGQNEESESKADTDNAAMAEGIDLIELDDDDDGENDGEGGEGRKGEDDKKERHTGLLSDRPRMWLNDAQVGNGVRQVYRDRSASCPALCKPIHPLPAEGWLSVSEVFRTYADGGRGGDRLSIVTAMLDERSPMNRVVQIPIGDGSHFMDVVLDAGTRTIHFINDVCQEVRLISRTPGRSVKHRELVKQMICAAKAAKRTSGQHWAVMLSSLRIQLDGYVLGDADSFAMWRRGREDGEGG